MTCRVVSTHNAASALQQGFCLAPTCLALDFSATRVVSQSPAGEVEGDPNASPFHIFGPALAG